MNIQFARDFYHTKNKWFNFGCVNYAIFEILNSHFQHLVCKNITITIN